MVGIRTLATAGSGAPQKRTQLSTDHPSAFRAKAGSLMVHSLQFTLISFFMRPSTGLPSGRRPRKLNALVEEFGARLGGPATGNSACSSYFDYVRGKIYLNHPRWKSPAHLNAGNPARRQAIVRHIGRRVQNEPRVCPVRTPR